MEWFLSLVGRIRYHSVRFLVLAITYAAERAVVLAVVLIPVLANTPAERVGRLEIALAAGVLGSTVGPLGTAMAVMHERFRDRRANVFVAITVTTIGGLLVGTLMSAQLGWTAMLAGGLLGMGLGWNRVAQNRMRVEGARGNILVTIPLVSGFALAMAAAPLFEVEYADMAPFAACAGGLAGLLALSWLIHGKLDKGHHQAREMVRFGLPISLGAVAFWVVGSADRYLIGWLIDLEAVGVYGPIYRIAMLFSGAAATVVVWWEVETLRLGAAWARDKMAHYVRIALPVATLGALVLWWPFTLAIERIVDHPRGEIAAIVGWIFVSVVLWTMAMGYLSPMVAASNSRAYAVSFGVAAVVNVLANLVAIPLFGLPGAAAVTALSQLAALITAQREVERYHRMAAAEVSAPAPS